jgi:hypothetical protein
MDIGKHLRLYLIAKAVVSTEIGTRMHPDGPPQGSALPFIVYYVISTEVEEDLQDGAADLAHAVLQLDCYAATRSEANRIAQLLRTKEADGGAGLQGLKGQMGMAWVAGCLASGGERYDRQSLGDGSDEWQYITSQDFRISYVE